MEQCARKPVVDLQAKGELWRAGLLVNAQQLRLLDKNLRHKIKAAEKLDHNRRKLVLKQQQKHELPAARNSVEENGAKAGVKHTQGSQLERVLTEHPVPPPL